jgi:hypothetical protein
MASFRRRPLAALAELRHRWPNGIEGTVDARGRFNEWPRLPYQISAFARRSARFLRLRPHPLNS